MKKLLITIEGKAYEVTVEVLDEPAQAAAPEPAPAHPISAGPAPAPPAPSPNIAPPAVGDVPCPLAGKVIAVSVTAGQQVGAGDQLLTIEAMKMNTYIYAPTAGTVSTVYVNAGDNVEEGQALVQIEKAP